MTRDRIWLAAVVLLVVATLACSTSNTPPVTPIVQVTSTTQPQASSTQAPAATQPPATTQPPAEPTPSPTTQPTTIPASAGCNLNAAFVADVTIPDNTSIAPGSAFVKTWRVKNSGTCDWGDGFQLVFASGEQMGGPASVPLSPVAVGATTDVAVNLVAPSEPGTHNGAWRISAKDGTIFGSNLTVVIVVPAPTNTPEPPTLTPSPTPKTGIILKPTLVLRHLPTVVYDLVDKANKATWQGWPGAISLPFPGSTSSSNGFALWVNSPTMEDGSKPSRCLETHPKWVTDGSIVGTYTDIFYSGYVVQSSDHLVAKAGFLSGAKSGANDANVKFKVVFRPEGGPNTTTSVNHAYNGSLVNIDIPLEAWAGKKADLILGVDALNPSASRDWACWVSAQILR